MAVEQEEFRVTLRQEDWVPGRNGWRCDVARFAKVEKLVFDGVSSETRAEGDIILWLGEKEKRPARPTAVFKPRASKSNHSGLWKGLGLASSLVAVALPLYCNEKLREKELSNERLIAEKKQAEEQATRESNERVALAKLNAEIEAAKKKVTQERDDCAKVLEYNTCVATGSGTVNCNTGTFNVGILKCLGIDSP